MKKRWISPCFDDSDSYKKIRTCSDATKKEENRIPTTVKSDAVTVAVVADNNNNQHTWIEKYKPQKRDDLVLHPKKLDEIENWCEKYSRNPDSCKYILLQGPPGCGKAVSFQVIAKSHGIQILEWITPMDREYDPENCAGDFESSSKIFKSFLSKASRYPSLFGSSVSALKAVLVKDIPNIFIRNPASFHDVLLEFSRAKSHAVVFVCSDDDLIRKLFPDDIKKSCNVETVSFNAVHCRAVIKALKRIVQLENKAANKKLVVSDSNLERIYNSTGGDLRSAILKFYFSCCVQSTKNSATSSSRVGKDAKDFTCDLFVGLGRVLYPKRQSKGIDASREYTFVHNPQEIVDAFAEQGNNFVSFLQENYLSRFSDIRNIAEAADTLSVADSFLQGGHNFGETNEYVLSAVTRGLMVLNPNPVKTFKPFVKPRFYKDNTLKDKNLQQVRELFPELCRHKPADIVLDVLPVLCKMSRLNQQQKDFSDKMTLKIQNFTT